MEDNSKVLLAIANELKTINLKLQETRDAKKEVSPDGIDYVQATEQRIIDLNKKIDAILLSQKKANTEQRNIIWLSMFLALAVIVMMIVNIVRVHLWGGS